MNQITYTYDGSFEGMLTAVAVAIKSKQQPKSITREEDHNNEFFCSPKHIPTDNAQVTRVKDYLTSKLRPCSLQHILYGYLSDVEDKEMLVHNYIKHSIKRGRQIDNELAHDSVKPLHEISRKVSYEIHRLTGFIRFREMADGTLYAPYTSDHHVILPVAQHFQKRLSNQRWVLHDINRECGLFWDTNELHEIELNHIPLDDTGKVQQDALADNEHDYQELWQTFFSTIAIPDRINPKLQRQFVPMRYRNFLVEF